MLRLAAQLQVLPSVGGREEFGGTREWGKRGGICDQDPGRPARGPDVAGDLALRVEGSIGPEPHRPRTLDWGQAGAGSPSKGLRLGAGWGWVIGEMGVVRAP